MKTIKNYNKILLNKLMEELNEEENVLQEFEIDIINTKYESIRNGYNSLIEETKNKIKELKTFILVLELEIESIENRKSSKNNILVLDRRGSDFWNGDAIKNISDCENYRITTDKTKIRGKDGNDYFIEFGNDKNNLLCIRTQIDLIDGTAWKNIELEKELNQLIKENNLLYTKESILKMINYISIDEYNRIVILK